MGGEKEIGSKRMPWKKGWPKSVDFKRNRFGNHGLHNFHPVERRVRGAIVMSLQY